ncbi:MAG: YidB family protein [Burkholderiaceae bacterium]
MGLLDSVIGAVSGNSNSAAPNEGHGLGSLIGALASNPQLLQAVTHMLANDGSQGGLGGLMAKFQQAGLGGALASWIGNGPNEAVSPDQLHQVLGSDAIGALAAKLGINPSQTADQLSRVLPALVNQLTPQGQAPAAGLGNSEDLMGMLDGLMPKR